MPTLNEKFEAWWKEHPTRDFKHPYDADHDVFLAGAKAEREEVLEIIREANATYHFQPEPIAVEIARRIKERDNG